MDRHRFRADWHDYSDGVYFVTICSRNYSHIFGSIVESKFMPSPLGTIVDRHINRIPLQNNDVALLNYVVMPNHIHMVLAVQTISNAVQVGTRLIASASTNETRSTNSNASNSGCLRPPRHGNPVQDNHHNSRLAVIIGAFKAGVTREARTRKIASLPVWQGRFHDHIIRTHRSFVNIMNYIDTNIINWEKDCFNE